MSRQENSNNLNIDTLERFINNTSVDVLPQKTDYIYPTMSVLIKHDFYSSDTDHGRFLLREFLHSLCNPGLRKLVVYLVDSGTCLLDPDNPLYKPFQNLANKSEMIIVSSDSMYYFGVEKINAENVVFQPFNEIVNDLVFSKDLLILE